MLYLWCPANGLRGRRQGVVMEVVELWLSTGRVTSLTFLSGMLDCNKSRFVPLIDAGKKQHICHISYKKKKSLPKPNVWCFFCLSFFGWVGVVYLLSASCGLKR